MTQLILSEPFVKTLSISNSADRVKNFILDTYRIGLAHNLSVNFLGLGDENDEVTFINTSKLKPFLEKGESNWKVKSFMGVLGVKNNQSLFEELGVNYDLLIEEPSKSELAKRPLNIISEGEKNGKSYCLVGIRDKAVVRQFVINKNCLTRTTLDEYVYSLTPSVGKVGRVVKTLLKDLGSDITDAEVEKFVNYFKSSAELSKNLFKSFHIVNGDLIHHFYQGKNYLNQKGTLGKSCMKSVDTNKLLFYTNNPEKCSLVILADSYLPDGTPDKIKGRALLWKTDDGSMLLDRIYTNNDSDVELFKQFAEISGFWSKTSQSVGVNTIELGGRRKKLTHRVTMDLSKTYQNIERGVHEIILPYVDSFKLLREHTTKSPDGKYSQVVMVGIGD